MHSTRRRLALAITATVTMISTAACGSSSEEANASIGVGARTDDMGAVGMAVVTNGQGVATVVGSLTNYTERADRLTAAHASAESGPVRAVLPRGDIEVPGGETRKLSARKGIMLVSRDLREGFFIDLTLDFARSPDINLEVPVEPQSGPYADIEVLTPADGDVAPPDE